MTETPPGDARRLLLAAEQRERQIGDSYVETAPATAAAHHLFADALAAGARGLAPANGGDVRRLLVEKWRREAGHLSQLIAQKYLYKCADELEAALSSEAEAPPQEKEKEKEEDVGLPGTTDTGNSQRPPSTSNDYPTDEQLERVRKWSGFFPHTDEHADYSAWFAFIKSLWWMPDWGWREYDGRDDGEPIRVFHISTGGWSGNEDIIEAMAGNFIGWSQTFRVHRRGGHYEFGFDRRGEKQPSPPATSGSTYED